MDWRYLQIFSLIFFFLIPFTFSMPFFFLYLPSYVVLVNSDNGQWQMNCFGDTRKNEISVVMVWSYSRRLFTTFLTLIQSCSLGCGRIGFIFGGGWGGSMMLGKRNKCIYESVITFHLIPFILWCSVQLFGVDPLQAGNVVEVIVVLGLTLGWVSTYIFRVSNKEMTYAQQLRDYEDKVMQV